MGLWDSTKNFFSGGGSGDIDKAYKEAQGYMRPYQQGGAQDYSNFRNYAQQFGQNLAPYGNAGQFQWNAANQSPTDYYNQIMGQYQESPQAKYEHEQAMRAANAGGSASGMLGSGAFFKALQQNAGDISARDQQRFFDNTMGANQMQMGYLGDLRGQQDRYNQMQQYLTSLGYGAAGNMGQNATNRGLAQAEIGRQTVGDIASMFGFGGGGGGLFGGGKGGGGGSGGGGANGFDMAKIAAMFM